MKKLLIAIFILQKVSNEERHSNGLKRRGQGYFNAYRLNPYNPFSYLLVLISIPIMLILFGVVGFFELAHNPFKWR